MRTIRSLMIVTAGLAMLLVCGPAQAAAPGKAAAPGAATAPGKAVARGNATAPGQAAPGQVPASGPAAAPEETRGSAETAAPSAKAAAEQLMDAWVRGDRVAASAAADGQVVETLFAEPTPGRPLPLKCRVTPEGTVCVHDPRAATSDAVQYSLVEAARPHQVAFLVAETAPGEYKVTRVTLG